MGARLQDKAVDSFLTSDHLAKMGKHAGAVFYTFRRVRLAYRLVMPPYAC